jgi:hypothetical protein
MAIVFDCGLDVQTYRTQFHQLSFPRPTTCPHCAATGQLHGHGSYLRHVCDHLEVVPIRVKRLRCAACRRTTSLLPSFCLPWRHYLATTIQRVLTSRFALGHSWRTIRQRFIPSDLPTFTTCRQWVQAFRAASASYVGHLLRQLAHWPWEPGKLELAIADMAAVTTTPQQLLAAVPHLVVWLVERGLHRVENKEANSPRWRGTSPRLCETQRASEGWLSILCRWGNVARLGRLV